MKHKVIAGTAALCFAAVLGTPPMADTIGEAEFLNSCAHCHGADGKGGGSIVAYLKAPVPDLSQLKKENGGAFPLEYVLWMVDGRNKIQIHGGDMPVWGERFQASALSERGETAEMVARGRILSVVYYLESIQE